MLRQLVESGEKVANPSFRCRFSVNAVLPDICEAKSANEFLRIYDSKSGLTRDFTSGKPLKASEKVCIFIQLLCKDPSLQFTNDFVRINLFQDSKEGFFKGINPIDLDKNKKEQLRFLSAVRTMVRFNSYIESTVDMKQTDAKNKMFSVANDTKLKDYTEY